LRLQSSPSSSPGGSVGLQLAAISIRQERSHWSRKLGTWFCMTLLMIVRRQTSNTLAGREGVIVSQTDSSIGSEVIFGSSQNAISSHHELSAVSEAEFRAVLCLWVAQPLKIYTRHGTGSIF
jgi:hypothetical protein